MNTDQKEAKVKYFCPMKCEGDKVYDNPGDCPVCNMRLVPLGEGVSAKEQKNPVHHDHSHSHDIHQEPGNDDKYYCTMLCEGDKTYPEPGDCPVCGMHLQKLEAVHRSAVIYTCPMHPEDKK